MSFVASIYSSGPLFNLLISAFPLVHVAILRLKTFLVLLHFNLFVSSLLYLSSFSFSLSYLNVSYAIASLLLYLKIMSLFAYLCFQQFL